MAKFVTMGAQLKCSFGMTPAPLNVVIPLRPTIQGKLMANIMDFIPMVNIPSFGMCRSQANPTVASATAAAMGVLTPMPCVPVITSPWSPGASEKVSFQPALMDNAKCLCTWGGQIEITNPGNSSTKG